MKMIWGIFKRDMCHATRNVIAVIVSMGLVVVPALYASVSYTHLTLPTILLE